MRKTFRCCVLATVVLGLSLGIDACSSSAKATPGPLATVAMSANPSPTPTVVLVEAADGTVQLKFHMSHNGSQQTGTLTLTQIGNDTQMAIELSPPAPVGQPVSLRRGTCEQPTGYVRDLDAVVGGVMRQKFTNMPIGQFAKGNLTVIVSPSTGTMTAVSACAAIPDMHRPDLPGYATAIK